MYLGVVFPQYEIGNDPALLRDFAQAVEALGYHHLAFYDHVVGADPNRPGGWTGRYSNDHAFHEPFVLMSYLAGFTQRIELVTGILILPQRQTVLTAKQAAELAIVSSGRLRLGVGIGWNALEYEALGLSFHDRGRRIEEQIDVMRRLWASETIAYQGTWHRIDRAGINPRPPGPIPIWMGGNHESVMKRAARLADGWFQPLLRPGAPEAEAKRDRLYQYLREAGRDTESFGIEGWVNYGPPDPRQWRDHVVAWQTWGATHVSVRTFDCGLPTPQTHIDAIRDYREGLKREGVDV